MIFKIQSRFNSESDNIVWMFETFDKLRSLENDILNKLNDTLGNIEVIDLNIQDVKRDTVLQKNNSIIYSSTVHIQYYYN